MLHNWLIQSDPVKCVNTIQNGETMHGLIRHYGLFSQILHIRKALGILYEEPEYLLWSPAI